MGGMNHYAQVRARLLQDPRVDEAARILSASEGIPEAWARTTVIGLCAELDVWLIRETDDGVAPGDGTTVVRASAYVSPSSARAAMVALAGSGLYEPATGGVKRVGFETDYRELLREREYARNKREGKGLRRRPRIVRQSDDSRTTSGRASADDAGGDVEVEPSTSTASASKVPVEPAVDVPPAVAVPPGEAAAAAPGGSGTRPGPCCVDGLVVSRGKARCCRVCDRGKERGRNMARAIQDEQAQKARALAARTETKAGLRAREPMAIGAIVPGILARLEGARAGPMARAGPAPPSGPGPGAA